ncbi:MAG: DnaJ C-terminal domain-containing protein [Burkholderiaceae bacterium]
MKYKDYYATLGVPIDADLDQIKKAYRKLARTHHPDMSKAADAESRFKEVAEAYATLKDPEKRAAYDELGRHPAGEEFSPPPQWQRDAASDVPSFDEADLADFLARMGRGHMGGYAHEPRSRRGRDYEAAIQISLEDALSGKTVNLSLNEGHDTKTLEVTIPPGVAQGQKLRLRGKGAKGHNGGENGDLYLHITLAPHPVFRTDGHDLYFDLALAPWEAALGKDIQVPTLDGAVMLTVPAGTQTGRKLRLRGRGLQDGKGGRGHLYAVVHIAMPATLTARERELYTQLSQVSTFNPRASATKEQNHASHAT